MVDLQMGENWNHFKFLIDFLQTLVNKYDLYFDVVYHCTYKINGKIVGIFKMIINIAFSAHQSELSFISCYH